MLKPQRTWNDRMLWWSLAGKAFFVFSLLVLVFFTGFWMGRATTHVEVVAVYMTAPEGSTVQAGYMLGPPPTEEQMRAIMSRHGLPRKGNR